MAKKRMTIRDLAVIVALLIGSLWLSQYVDRLPSLASREIVEIAENSGMSAEGKSVFYSARPQIVGRKALYQFCPTAEEHLAPGCVTAEVRKGSTYAVVNDSVRIYLLSLPQLDSLRGYYATAAHEMLHVVYIELTERERNQVDSLLYEEFVTLFADPAISLVLDPDELRSPDYDELHATFGTWQSNLLPELAAHYSKYFDDRDKIISFYQDTDFGKLLNAGTELTLRMLYYRQILSQMNEQMLERKKEGDYTTFNEMVPQYNAIADRHNDLVSQQNKVREQFKESYLNPS